MLRDGILLALSQLTVNQLTHYLSSSMPTLTGIPRGTHLPSGLEKALLLRGCRYQQDSVIVVSIKVNENMPLTRVKKISCLPLNLVVANWMFDSV